ncbi:RNA polymerase subunit sigma [Paramagnetospirillum marisnigri]|uniref:RNA polymerase subunit sigma n=1 Tax=Paramagnetospirillum marisnigri TaxID=1285242 RepID=A0A178MS43_9PROT|nr:RNA polymerase sigma factor [Paramagnetospirillum marisnigri]OAN52285.1 RNA polymerase subunit sigma [Paramagnetospirillum marisnigri]
MRATSLDGQTSHGTETSDDKLLQAVARGDRTAFRQLMDRHARPMLALATRITGNPDDADEIVQDAFMKTWSLAAKWRADGPASFGTWLYRVVLNACLDRKRRAPFSPLEDAGDPADPGIAGVDYAMGRQREAVLAAAMADIPSRQRQALALYYFSDLSAPEAARVLDLSVSALEALLVRGRRALRDLLQRRGITGSGDLI